MKLLTFSVSAFLLSLAFALVLGACGGSGSSAASSSAWEPFLVLKAPNAHAQNELIASLSPRPKLTWNVWGSAYAAASNSPGCPGIGTVAPPSASDSTYQATSCSGVLYSLLPCPDATGPCIVAGLPQGQAILFDTANCLSQGPGQDEFVSPSFDTFGTPSISSVAISPGILFRYDPQGLGAGDSSTYLMLAPGGGKEVQVTVQSEYVFGNGCAPVSSVNIQAFALAPNAASVTSMLSAAVPAPVSIGTP